MKDKIHGQKLEEFKKDKMINRHGEEVDSCAHHWLMRASAMQQRRSYFENMWQRWLYDTVAFMHTEIHGKVQFDPSIAPELQTYASKKYSRAGSGFSTMSHIKYPLEFAVIMRKLAVEIKNMPNIEWSVAGVSDQSAANLWGDIYNEVMSEAGGDYEDYEMMLSKGIFGTSVRWSRLISYENTVSEPEIDDSGNIIYTDKKRTIREFKSTTVDLRHVLIDEGCTSSDLSDCEDAIVFEYYTEDEAKLHFADIDFDKLGIKAMPRTEVFQDINDLNGGDTKLFYELMNCYNRTTDSYIKIMNGKVIGDSPIPMKSFKGKKMLPIAFMIDHKIPGQPYGIGAPALIKAFTDIKNKNRDLIYDVTKKSAKPTIAVDPLSSFSEENYFFGQDFLRIAPGDMQPIPVQANLDPALSLDERTDNDVVIVTGVNILDTAAPSGAETATRTVVRKESQVALIDLGMHLNTVTGIKRLHTINANILRLHLSVPQIDLNGQKQEFNQVSTSGKKYFRGQPNKSGKVKKAFLEEESQGTHTFSYKGEDIDFEFRPTVKLGNIAFSDQLKKDVQMENLQILANIAPEAYDQAGVAAFIQEIGELPKAVLKKVENKSPIEMGGQSEDQMVKDLLSQGGAVIPEDEKFINDYKNAQADQRVVQDATSPSKVGAGGEAAGLPPVGAV